MPEPTAVRIAKAISQNLSKALEGVRGIAEDSTGEEHAFSVEDGFVRCSWCEVDEDGEEQEGELVWKLRVVLE